MSTRVRWLGHAALLLESDGRTLLIDPFLTGNPKAAVEAGDVPADLILISHGHGDHVGDSVAIAKRTGATVATNYEISEWLMQPSQGMSAAKVQGLQHGGSFLFDQAVRVKLTLAFHGSVLPDGTYGGNPCGFIVTFPDGTKIYDAADTARLGDMALIGEEGLDLAIFPLGDFLFSSRASGSKSPSSKGTRRHVQDHHFTAASPHFAAGPGSPVHCR